MSATMIELLGEKLCTSDGGEVATKDALAGKSAVALYFSAHWCPPCRGFTPQLATWYKEGLSDKGLEIVFISSDRDEPAFKEYAAEQPWKSLPYADRARKDGLSKKFKVEGIPTLIVLDGDGKVLNADGRSAISSDPKGEDFPWKQKTLKEILAACKFIGKDGPVDASVLDGKVFALYFSAHWCPPCRGFTPQLAEMYTKSFKDKGLEIVFVSSDKDEAQFKEYYGEQPWLALDFACKKEKDQLSKLFDVGGIPSLVIVDKDGSTITNKGRAAVSKDPEGSKFPWYPNPVNDLAEGPGPINAGPVVLLMCEAAAAESKSAAEAAAEPLAKKFIDEAKVAGEDPAVSFAIAKASDGITIQIRSMSGLLALPPAAHEHALAEKDVEGGHGWGCDGCGQGGRPGMKRFRCAQGCDFDHCEECNGKAGSGSVLPPKLLLVNIPDDGAYYAGPEGEVTAAALEAFVSDFQAGKLERKQLQM